MKTLENQTIQQSEDQINFEPRILAFLCNWCSYAGADLAGVSRFQYPTNIRVIRVPCSGRINPLYIIKALQSGYDGVLVSGCHPGDCHYISGNFFARRKFALLKKFLEYIGIEPERVQFSWVSAAEGARFAQIIEKVTNEIKKLGPLAYFRKDLSKLERVV
jgi:F420-non-reducing hydrogenase iron-sulfur subunit